MKKWRKMNRRRNMIDDIRRIRERTRKVKKEKGRGEGGIRDYCISGSVQEKL